MRGERVARMTLHGVARTHLGDVLRWRRGEPVDRRTIAVAALGMAVPVLAGLASGRAEIGFTIGLGAMLLAGGGPAETGTAAATKPPPGSALGSGAASTPGSAVWPAVIAVIAATAIAGHAWSDAATVLLATAAATISGYSRPVGVAAIRFIIYLILGLSLLAGAGEHREGAALIFGLGALWNVAVRTMLRRAPAAVAPPPGPTAAQRRARWRRTMRELAGWQFPIRLAAGLALASAVRAAWPAHHYGWIVVTVALLTQRALEHVPVKITQRALGTALGVASTWAILAAAPPAIVLALAVCLLASLAPIARARSYLVYSAISTPAILLVLDIGRPIATALLVDRLVATLAGAAIVVAANLAADRWIPKPAPKPARRGRPGVAKPGEEGFSSPIEAAPPAEPGPR